MFNSLDFGNSNAVGYFGNARLHTRNWKYDAEQSPVQTPGGEAGQSAAARTTRVDAAQTDAYIPGDSLTRNAGAYSASQLQQSAAMGSTLSEPEDTGLAGADNTGLRNYLDYGMGKGNTSLAALNASRKRLGERINQVMNAAGITLRSDEKITFSVDGKNNFVVGGLKDKAKAKRIQDALNEDKKLGSELRKLVAAGKINQYEKSQALYQDETKTDGSDKYTNRSMRAFIIDDYLVANAGVSLSDLSVTRGADGNVSINGANEDLNALLAEDPTLADTIANILDNNEHAMEFSASFEFANGSLSDSTTMDMAKDKLDAVKIKLMGGYNKDTQQQESGMLADFLATVTHSGGEGVDEELKKALSGGFSIRIAVGGGFEIVAGDGLDPKYKDTLEGIVQKALDEWAEDNPHGNYGTGEREASFADVFEAFNEQHRFEDGDVDEFAHMLEIDLKSNSRNEAYKMISPDADAAQNEKNQQKADELGAALKGMLEEEGIDAEGLEMTIDEDGKITVLGDAANPEVKKAQAIIDSFVQDAKGVAKGKAAGGEKGEETDPGDAQTSGEAFREAQSVREGKPYESEHAEANGMGGVAARGEKYENEIAELIEAGKAEKYGRVLYTFAKYDTGTQFGGYLNPVSNIIPEWSLLAKGSAAGAGGPSLRLDGAGEDEADAYALYAEYMSGMGQFHDDSRHTYKMGA